MRLFRRNDFTIEDIENRIIELDDFEEEPTPEDLLHINGINEINEKDYKKINDMVVNGLYIMAISGTCCCFALLSLLYPFL
jgi:hypothetical protein